MSFPNNPVVIFDPEVKPLDALGKRPGGGRLAEISSVKDKELIGTLPDPDIFLPAPATGDWKGILLEAPCILAGDIF